MNHSTVAAIEAREFRIAALERRLQERENTVSDQANELVILRGEVVRLRHVLKWSR